MILKVLDAITSEDHPVATYIPSDIVAKVHNVARITGKDFHTCMRDAMDLYCAQHGMIRDWSDRKAQQLPS